MQMFCHEDPNKMTMLQLAELATPMLDTLTTSVPRGVAYFPFQRVILGDQAAKAMMETLLELPFGERYYNRDPHLSAFQQLACVLHYKFARKLGRNPKDWIAKAINDKEAIKEAFNFTPVPLSRRVQTWTCLYNSTLP